MKKVLVSQRVDHYPDRNESRDALDQQLIRFLLACGLLPIPVPNVLVTGELHKILDRSLFHEWVSEIHPHGIVLSGGNDIGSCLNRDMTERALLDYAISQHRPVLGICRGMQFMGHYSGMELKQVENHVRTRHILVGEFGHEVNSYHNIALMDCPQDYDVTAMAEDGEIEGIRHKNRNWEGWMWHPEREIEFNQKDIKRVKELFK
jgi:gamma-glutamyl-gamma-aminobutyrate hydrolase PuuD